MIPKQLQNPDFRFVKLGKHNEWGRFENINGKSKLVEKKVVPPEDYEKMAKQKIWKALGKMPFESAWQKRDYKFDDAKLLKHIASGLNFGIIGGYGNLVIVDIDDTKLAEQLEQDFDTFTIKTGGGGRHFYFIIENGK